MLGLLAGIFLMPLSLIVFWRAIRAIRETLRYASTLPARPSTSPPATIAKPVYGADAYTEENFRSWAEQDYDGPVQLIFSFQRGDDPALPIARRGAGNTASDRQPGCGRIQRQNV